jgi:hypothetical protein
MSTEVIHKDSTGVDFSNIFKKKSGFRRWSDGIGYNGCEHEQCGFGANQLSLTTNLVGTTHFHNQKTSIAYACC